jgi:hypothetical protein
MVLPPRRAFHRLILAIAGAAAALSLLAHAPARAEERFEAHYRATLSGLTIGTGSVVVDIARNRFSISGKGKATGLMRILGGGAGEVTAQGAISGKKLVTASYAHAIKSRKLQAVTMTLASGAVKQLAVEPPPKAEEDRVELTEAQKRGVLDPVTAGIVPAAGPSGVGPEVCARKLPVFDGHRRFDLVLSYKRQETVRAEGYHGPAVVCGVTFEPIGGHRRNKYAIKFLSENRDMEIWFAPIGGTPFLAVYRVSLPTPLGTGVLQATRFAVTTDAARAGAVDARVR